jgi:hypothetical protein
MCVRERGGGDQSAGGETTIKRGIHLRNGVRVSMGWCGGDACNVCTIKLTP